MMNIGLDLQVVKNEEEATHILVLDKKDAVDFESGKVYRHKKIHMERLALDEENIWSKNFVYSEFLYLRAVPTIQ